MLVKMFLCFYLNVPPRSFNPIRLSYDDENKVEPVTGDLESLEVMESWLRLQPQIQRQAWAQGLACGASWAVFLVLRLPSFCRDICGEIPDLAMCARLFILFYLQTFWTLNLGFVVVGRVWNVVLISVWEPHGLGHVTLHLWMSTLSVNWELGWLTSNDFQGCDPEPVNSVFIFLFLFYYTQHAFLGEGWPVQTCWLVSFTNRTPDPKQGVEVGQWLETVFHPAPAQMSVQSRGHPRKRGLSTGQREHRWGKSKRLSHENGWLEGQGVA